MWLSACAIVCMAGNTLLSWYIGWYQEVPSGYDDAGFPYRVFFAIFLRSWLLVHVTSELCRSCYVLFTDAWSLDVFGAYRRALSGYASVDMWSEESIDGKGYWPESVLASRRLWLDILFQWAIYLSLDIVPIVCGLVTAMKICDWDDYFNPSSPLTVMFQALLNCSLVHVCLFFLAVNMTDLYEKVVAFSWAWTADRQEAESDGGRAAVELVDAEAHPATVVLPPDNGDEAGEGASEEGPLVVAAAGRCLRALGACRQRLVALRRSLVFGTRRALARVQGSPGSSLSTAQRSLGSEVNLHDGLIDRQTQTEALGRDSVAERLSLCVRLCSWLDVIAWEVVFVAVVVGLFVAAWALKTLLYIALCIIGALVVLYWRCRWALMAEEGWEKSHLQLWGETHCSLGPAERKASQTSAGLVLILQGSLFGLAQQWTGLWVCVSMLCLQFMREVALMCERNRGWWIGLSEGFAIWLVIVCINRSVPDVMSTLFLAVLHQFGLRRFMHKGARLVKAINGIMYLMLVIVVGTVLLSVAPADAGDWSAFEPGGRNYTITPQPSGRGLMCQSRYASGEDGVSFSLGDFALWSSLAYESERTMPAALDHFFPGWKVVFNRTAGSGGNPQPRVGEDWTTFFEYSHPHKPTSIIAIRGTDTALDALNDINIWLTAALMMGFEIAGPWMFASISEVVAYMSVVVGGSGRSKEHFSELLAWVQRRLAEEPHRKFYITGHSLGGGLAKLVSSQTKVQAITFMAPGISRTRFAVFGTRESEAYMGSLSLTVQPTQDLVSRVDSQMGSVVPVRCLKGPYACHMIYEGAICPMLELCGSMRIESVEIPCGQCTSLPC